MTVQLKGRIDSSNAAQVEQELLPQLAGQTEIVLDAQDLAYISSAGLWVILRIRKDYPSLRIVNVNSDVYEILDMTGFTDMMPVEKAYRVVSVEAARRSATGPTAPSTALTRTTWSRSTTTRRPWQTFSMSGRSPSWR